MRKLVESTLVSLDGVVESPERWVQTHWDYEAMQFALSQLSEFDAFLMGV
jgi:hypothetical protein